MCSQEDQFQQSNDYRRPAEEYDGRIDILKYSDPPHCPPVIPPDILQVSQSREVVSEVLGFQPDRHHGSGRLTLCLHVGFCDWLLLYDDLCLVARMVRVISWSMARLTDRGRLDVCVT